MLFRQLQYLVAVAQEEHFGRAALRCNVSQPSLSSGIKQLELRLQVPIVLRGRRFLGFTNEGNQIIEWAERVLSQHDAMMAELSKMRGSLEGRVRLGVMPNSSPIMPLLSRLLRKNHPDVEIDIHFMGIEETIIGLQKYTIDVGVTYMQSELLGDLKSLHIYDEGLSLLVPNTEEYKDITSITWKDAASLPLCLLSDSTHERKIIDNAFSKAGTKPKAYVTSDSIMNLVYHVMFAGLVTVIPQNFLLMSEKFSGVRAIKLVEPEVIHQVGLVWSSTEPMMPMARAMVAIIKELKASNILENKGDDNPFNVNS
jgi:DNA-binding transcriptional LysR family regulator